MQTNEKIQVPNAKFDEMKDKVSAMQLSNGYVTKTVIWGGDEYVMTGSIGSFDKGVYAVFGDQVVALEQYRGTLEPLEYHRHFLAVGEGKRERGYEGMKTRNGKRTLVFVGKEIECFPTNEGIQIELFQL